MSFMSAELVRNLVSEGITSEVWNGGRPQMEWQEQHGAR
jgi:hypothetical protein